MSEWIIFLILLSLEVGVAVVAWLIAKVRTSIDGSLEQLQGMVHKAEEIEDRVAKIENTTEELHAMARRKISEFEYLRAVRRLPEDWAGCVDCGHKAEEHSKGLEPDWPRGCSADDCQCIRFRWNNNEGTDFFADSYVCRCTHSKTGHFGEAGRCRSCNCRKFVEKTNPGEEPRSKGR